MRKIRIIEHISLDGVIQAPGGRNEDGDYPHGGWAVPHSDPAVGEAIDAGHGEAFDLLLGRRTYDIWSDYWPKAENSPMADSLNEATKYVATHRPDSLGWGPVEDLGPDIVEGVRRADDWPPVSRSLPQRDCTRYRPRLAFASLSARHNGARKVKPGGWRSSGGSPRSNGPATPTTQ